MHFKIFNTKCGRHVQPYFVNLAACEFLFHSLCVTPHVILFMRYVVRLFTIPDLILIIHVSVNVLNYFFLWRYSPHLGLGLLP
jgi:hypothetical protein